MHKQTKLTNIPKQVKTAVWLRDGRRCISCGLRVGIESACSHVVRRSRGGLGIEQNVVTHCFECHRLYDSFDEWTVRKTLEYIERKYPGWNPDRVKYTKYGKNQY